jgi:AcrR family transcriptional regulator
MTQKRNSPDETVDSAAAGGKTGDTKQRIIAAAIMLFSDRSYATVTTRDIAKRVGIQPASLYSHFPSKEDILRHIYAWYEKNARQVWPDMDRLLAEAKTVPPRELLMRSTYYFDPSIQELMDRIVAIGVMESRVDPESEAFIEKNILNIVENNTRRLLSRLVELGRIEPVDIAAFTTILANFSYAAALRNSLRHQVTKEEWIGGIELLYTLIQPTGK